MSLTQTPPNVETTNANEPVVFQVIDWRAIELAEEIETPDGKDTNEILTYGIRLFGRTKEGKTVTVEVQNFKPFFYVKVPTEWDDGKINVLLQLAKSTVERYDFQSEKPPCAESLLSHKVVRKCIFKEFTNYELFKFIKLTFNSYSGFKAYERAFNKPFTSVYITNGKKDCRFDVYESNIDPLLRFMHIRNLSAMGMITISTYSKFMPINNISLDDISIYTDWKNVSPIPDDKTMCPFIVASFDIECYSSTGGFPNPQLDEDQIIQIGTTFHRHGETECYKKHIITLDTCDKIGGAEVVQCKSEEEVLLQWTKLIRKINPDVITGYNIYVFDFYYMYERAKKLGCHSQFAKLSKIKNEESPYVTKDLSSAALGKNILTYYDMSGRVTIDMYKVIQRDHKLSSYKLDSVAADFIKDKIVFVQFGDGSLISKDNCGEYLSVDTDGGQTKIFTKGIYGLEVGRYVKVFFNDGLSDNSYKGDMKFQVLEIKSKALVVEEEEKGKVKKVAYDMIVIDGVLDEEAMMLDKYTIYWCQAKDDVSAQDIFRMQKQTSKERAVVAKYCLQDCMLVNKLMNKLQIISNNSAMAIVSNVPFSYIFLRGQGIKIFSLVAKKCRERNHLIPVMKRPYVDKEKKKLEDSKKTKAQLKAEKEAEELIYGYEGATVFEPKTGVYLIDSIVVLDYNSLYPNSMRCANMSHETIVTQDKYRELDDYYYEDVSYTNKDESVTTVTFCKPKDVSKPRGILVEIITDLLNARAYTRKLQATETDDFKWRTLESMQLAFKVTANSLYGSCGAPTNNIYNKNIAASTTATGRKMLNIARIFTEVIFKQVADMVKAGEREKYEAYMGVLFDKKIDEAIGEAEVEKLKVDKTGERYSYLQVFKGNTSPLDGKFVDVRAGLKSQGDYVEWLWGKMSGALDGCRIEPDVIYGDTDSIFINFKIRRLNGESGEWVTLDNYKELCMCFDLGRLCSGFIFKLLPDYENLCFEKVFQNFALLSKKRYVGNKYEESPDDYYVSSMGIVLKRRDNAPIVKICVGLIVKSILEYKSIDKALEFTKQTLRNILSGKYKMDKFVVSKTLKGPAMNLLEQKSERRKAKEDRFYADRTRMAHAVLADRMYVRGEDRIQSNERVPYVYVRVDDSKVEVQGDRVEHPDYVVKNELEIDYVFYITNQIMKPALQFLELLTENAEKLFENVIMIEENRRHGKRPLNYYFKLLADIDNAKNMPDAFEDEGDARGEEWEDDEDGEFMRKFVTDFENDVGGVGDVDAKAKVVKKVAKKVVRNVAVKKGAKKGINAERRALDDNGGFSL